MAELTYFGHSTVLIKTSGGKLVLIDPFLDGNPLCPEELQTPAHVDLICLTHGHSDHAGSAVRIAKQFGATVCATFELASLLAADGVPEQNIQFMNKGGTVSVSGLSVSLTQAFHSSSYQTSSGTTEYAGEAAGIVIEMEDGRAVYHAGDTLLFSDMQLIKQKFAPVLALLPIGDRFTMGPEDAARALAYIEPAIAIPIHFGTFPLLTGTPEEFIAAAGPRANTIQVLEPGQTLSF